MTWIIRIAKWCLWDLWFNSWECSDKVNADSHFPFIVVLRHLWRILKSIREIKNTTFIFISENIYFSSKGWDFVDFSIRMNNLRVCMRDCKNNKLKLCFDKLPLIRKQTKEESSGKYLKEWNNFIVFPLRWYKLLIKTFYQKDYQKRTIRVSESSHLLDQIDL